MGALVVDIVTWTTLYPAAVAGNNTGVLLNTGSYHMHILNAVFLLLDYALNDSRFDAWDAWVMVLWPLWYGFFHVCWTGAGHAPVYFFLKMGLPHLGHHARALTHPPGLLFPDGR